LLRFVTIINVTIKELEKVSNCFINFDKNVQKFLKKTLKKKSKKTEKSIDKK
jgi:hypothetical protein